MGFLSKIKNAVTGGEAQVTIQFEPAQPAPGSTVATFMDSLLALTFLALRPALYLMPFQPRMLSPVRSSAPWETARRARSSARARTSEGHPNSRRSQCG